MAYKINLDIFEGPLDLLLYFIKRDEINIYDIPIARITAEYLEYLEMMTRLDLQIAGEFVEMASTLMQIKSRMLIPRVREAVEEETMEDPRTELVQKLLEYQRYKELAKELERLEEKQLPFFSREPNLSYLDTKVQSDDVLHRITLFEILAAFKAVMDRLPDDSFGHEVVTEEANVRDQIEFIYGHFIRRTKVNFSELTKRIRSRVTLIVTFMAVLEMMKTQQVRVLQAETFDDFIIEKIEGEHGES